MSRKPRTKACPDCAKPITAQATRCQPCATRKVNSDPAIAKARADAIRAKFREPAHRAKMMAVAKRNGEKACADPAHMARLVEHGRKQYAAHLNTPEARAANQAARAGAGRKRTETVLGWCLPELRDEYRYWTISRRRPAAEARAIIEAKMADLAAVRSGELGNAVFYLNRYTTAKKLDDGSYRYGSAVLGAGEMMRRALAKGWTPAFSNRWVDRLAA